MVSVLTLHIIILLLKDKQTFITLHTYYNNQELHPSVVEAVVDLLGEEVLEEEVVVVVVDVLEEEEEESGTLIVTVG